MQVYITQLVTAFWHTLVQMAPYLLLGFAVAGVMSVLISRRFVETHLGGRGLWPVIKASLFGIPLPLCSCGVIPVGASLRRHGASKGSTISFLISTPQTGVDSFFVTYSLLGWIFAIFRPIITFVTGILGGGLTNAVESEEDHSAAPPTCGDDCCNGARPEPKLKRAFKYGFITLPKDISRAVLVGIAIAAVITVFVPEDFFAEVLPGGIVSMLVMMAVGIPLYVCASASVPVAAALIVTGISPGAALVFLMVGPATNGATIATIWQVLGWRTTLVYLATIAVCALAAGMLLDGLFPGIAIRAVSDGRQTHNSLIGSFWAITLLHVLIYGIYRSYRDGKTSEKTLPADPTAVAAENDAGL